MKIENLIEERKNQFEAMDKFLDEKAVDGVLTVEDDAEYSKMQEKFDSLTNTIKKLEKKQEMENEMNKPTSQPITSAPIADEIETNTGVKSKAYKEAILDAFKTNFRKVSNVLEEGTDANGGYLVPPEYDSEILDVLAEENVMRNIATTIKTSGEHRINIAGTKPAAAWVDEGEALTFDTGTFDQKQLDAHKLHVAIKVTEELLYDNAFNLESYITRTFAQALANAEENAFINGSGSGQPKGFLADAQTGITTASATAITADEVINLVYKLKRPYRKNACFIANDSTVAMIRTLKDTTGNYLWQPSLQAGEPDRLLGYPLYTSAYMPSVEGGAKPLAFGDFKYYTIGDRGNRSFAALRELFAGNGMVGFLAKERVDGKLLIAEAVQVLKMKAAG